MCLGSEFSAPRPKGEATPPSLPIGVQTFFGPYGPPGYGSRPTGVPAQHEPDSTASWRPSYGEPKTGD
jgi:hypothetical protein